MFTQLLRHFARAIVGPIVRDLIPTLGDEVIDTPWRPARPPPVTSDPPAATPVPTFPGRPSTGDEATNQYPGLAPGLS
jgi:hypothetical protein